MADPGQIEVDLEEAPLLVFCEVPVCLCGFR